MHKKSEKYMCNTKYNNNLCNVPVKVKVVLPK